MSITGLHFGSFIHPRYAMSRFRFTFGLAALSAIAVLGGVACGSSSSPAAPTVAADVTITMVGDRGSQSYTPNPNTMRVGQTVAWKNADTIAHTATQDASRFDSGTIGGGATSAPLTMSTAGTFTYHCTIHPGMVGTLIVQ
jgi:plastocyanin